MEKYTYYTLLLIGALLLLSLLRFIPFHQLFPDIDTEEKMVDITHFDLHDNTSGSLVQGAMFAGMSDVTRQVIITARIWISPKDFGGVEFSIPQEWVVTEKYSSYPGGEMESRPESLISEWHTGGLAEYNRRVRITRYVDSYDTYISGEGKEGYVVLLLQPEGGKHPPEECHICVGVGSKMIKNISVIHPTFGEYAVNFTPPGKDLHMPISGF